jgi:hypothetical protein
LLSTVSLICRTAHLQKSKLAPQAPVRAQEAAGPIQTQSQPSTRETFYEGQIEQLVAPIALYPDPLLSQVLMASTYPLEVVEAARWYRAAMSGAKSCVPARRSSDQSDASRAAVDFIASAVAAIDSDQPNSCQIAGNAIERTAGSGHPTVRPHGRLCSPPTLRVDLDFRASLAVGPRGRRH